MTKQSSRKEIQAYLKEVSKGEEVEIYFVQISWPTSHTPETEEVLLYRLSLAEWAAKKAQYYSRILNDKKYFRICGSCFEVTHVGHMHDKSICQGCAERDMGVVY